MSKPLDFGALWSIQHRRVPKETMPNILVVCRCMKVASSASIVGEVSTDQLLDVRAIWFMHTWRNWVLFIVWIVMGNVVAEFGQAFLYSWADWLLQTSIFKLQKPCFKEFAWYNSVHDDAGSARIQELTWAISSTRRSMMLIALASSVSTWHSLYFNRHHSLGVCLKDPSLKQGIVT